MAIKKKDDLPQKMTVKQFIKWRQSMGLTQAAAAKMLGFKHRSSICHIEKGIKNITAQLSMLCRVFEERKRTE